jgi:hypothetical protein
VKDVAGAVGVDHQAVGHVERRRKRSRLVSSYQSRPCAPMVTPPTADAARAQIGQHLAGRELHLFAQPLGDDRGADEGEQVVGIRTQAAAVERRQDAGLVTDLGVVDGGVGQMSVDMERAAAGEIEQRKGCLKLSSRQRTIARWSPFGMMNDNDDSATLRWWTEMPYFAPCR